MASSDLPLPPPLHPVRSAHAAAPQAEPQPRAPSEAVSLCPLREVPVQGGGSMFVYTPFSTSDLYNWKSQNPPFSKDPDSLINFLESVFFPLIVPLGMTASRYSESFSLQRNVYMSSPWVKRASEIQMALLRLTSRE